MPKRYVDQPEFSYEAFLANVAGMVYRCRNDPDWTMELVSEGCFGICGYAREELEGNRVVAFGDLVHPDDQEWLWEKCQTNLDARRRCSNEYRILDRDGEVRWVWDQAQGIYGAGGELLAIEGLITDITSRKQLEAQLVRFQRLDAMGRLAGGLAHDFNNLLSAIKIHSHLLGAHVAGQGGEVDECLTGIMSSVEAAAALTRKLLTLGRLQPSELVRVDLNDVVTDLSQLLRVPLGAEIEVRLDVNEAPCLVLADSSQLEQVVLNLAVNARDAMPEGGVLEIRTATVELSEGDRLPVAGLDPGPYAVLTVRDTGHGMEPAVCAQAFEPLFTTRPGGNGLGLATVHTIVKQSAGGVVLRSVAGTGTTFEVYLPLAEEPLPAEKLHEGKGQRVLLVDDDPAVLDVMTRVLEGGGYRVVPAKDAEQALALAAEHEPQVLVTDIGLPGMSGRELAARLGAERSDLSTILVSGNPPRPGDRNFIAKPFAPSALLRKVGEALRG